MNHFFCDLYYFSVALSCGGKSSENCTYLEMASTKTPAVNPCTYTICSASKSICRIRFDFDSFVIASPYTVTPFDPFTSTSPSGEMDTTMPTTVAYDLFKFCL